MAGDDAVHDREPHAGPGRILRPVKALEDAEELVGVAHVESGAVVLHLVDGLAALDPAADPDQRLGLVWRCTSVRCR